MKKNRVLSTILAAALCTSLPAAAAPAEIPKMPVTQTATPFLYPSGIIISFRD